MGIFESEYNVNGINDVRLFDFTKQKTITFREFGLVKFKLSANNYDCFIGMDCLEHLELYVYLITQDQVIKLIVSLTYHLNFMIISYYHKI